MHHRLLNMISMTCDGLIISDWDLANIGVTPLSIGLAALCEMLSGNRPLAGGLLGSEAATGASDYPLHHPARQQDFDIRSVARDSGGKGDGDPADLNWREKPLLVFGMAMATHPPRARQGSHTRRPFTISLPNYQIHPF
jgi:hypothetical protein